METQGYAFEPGLTVGELLKSSQKDWQVAINHRFVKELFAGTIENKVLKDYLIQDEPTEKVIKLMAFLLY